ncbi:MAG TPA: chemotaxis response regulator protein-glutamate methylesterase [Bryobacteraceae bacterium]|nr:chemotaxis response regulator protein-glutamate methylesterase [Bryobacteraceae bacterium]
MGLFSKRTIRRGSRIRVLVVDDSVVIRRLVSHALGEETSIEVVGTAPNGAIGLARIPQLNPDVITLDIEMPEMDGLEMLRQLRKTYKDIRVIMFSTLTERGAASTMEALSLGADDYVTKASNEGSLDRSMATLRSELIPKIRQFFTLEAESAALPRSAEGPSRAQTFVPRASTFQPSVAPEIVAIGVSTGGPNALGAIMPTFPADFPLPILIVQHMPPVFTRLLADRLQTITKLKVEEATDGATVEPGKVLIAPGDRHMRVRKGVLKTIVTLDQEPPENSCRPAVDVLFRSVEEAYGAAVISVILTGMGYDGLRGMEVLKAHGAYVIAKDEATSVVWGMPGAVVNAGLADSVVPLDGVVPEILRRTARESFLAVSGKSSRK